MSSNNRRCSCCRIIGHTIQQCEDAVAKVRLSALMSNTNQQSALNMVRCMPCRFVKFSLHHGFGAPVSGGRASLRECIISRFTAAAQTVSLTEMITPSNSRSAYVRTMSEIKQLNQIEMNELGAQLSRFQMSTVTVELLPGNELLEEPLQPSTQQMVSINYMYRVANDFARVTFFGYNEISDMNNFIRPRIWSPIWIETELQPMIDELNIWVPATGISIIILLVKLRYCSRLNGMIEEEAQSIIDSIQEEQLATNNQMKTLKTTVSVRNTQIRDAVLGCGVCFDDLTPVTVVRTGCGHDFCVSCISNWAKTRGIKSFIQCPCCRAEIDTLTVGDDAERIGMVNGLAPVMVTV